MTANKYGFPGKIIIGGKVYSLSVLPFDQGQFGKLGQCDFKNQTILLTHDQGQDCARDSLLHELIHLFLFHAGYADQDEKLVSTIAHGLDSVLRQNPKLIQIWTTKGETK